MLVLFTLAPVKVVVDSVTIEITIGECRAYLGSPISDRGIDFISVRPSAETLRLLLPSLGIEWITFYKAIQENSMMEQAEWVSQNDDYFMGDLIDVFMVEGLESMQTDALQQKILFQKGDLRTLINGTPLGTGAALPKFVTTTHARELVQALGIDWDQFLATHVQTQSGRSMV